MSKHKKRPQKPKGMGNRAMHDAIEEQFRSNAAVPHRNRARYSRNDGRRQAQRGWE